MLLTSTPSLPKRIAGRRIAYETPVSASARSTSALPRKYGYGDSIVGFVMLTCTMRCTPAWRAAWNSVREFSIACA